MVLDVLANSMKVGYAAWIMLLRADFSAEEDRVLYQPPTSEDIEDIWKNIIHAESVDEL
jgi:hypothetical protein